ncbi:HutD/Ves family protein [Paraburkholderia guartelaensis]|uniref:HutD/Ves family protein n=1 Tax=Paraburkholderia guartelaensis TaxID=2546446 RepID=UPI002AB74F4D|nr:HutD family protein [Paraburkholderia guartelaensis]
MSQGAKVTLLRGVDLVPAPWKNGGGVTREIATGCAASAPDGFAWRASLADIAQAGPFSCFEGIDRTLVLIDGAALQLNEARAEGQEPHATHTLERALDIARFAGEAAIDARIAAGPVRVFNLMVRREAARGALEVWREATRRSVHAQTVLLHAVQRQVEVSVAGEGFIALVPGDTLRVDAEQAVDLATRGEGALLVVTLDIAQA